MLSKFSVSKPYTVIVVTIIIVLLGIIAFSSMTTDLLPSIDLPFVAVITSYPGASPEDVELRVTKPLEQALSTTSNVQNITSTSSENSSMLFLEFTQGTNMDSVIIEMNGTIDRVEAQWGEGIGSPILMKINPDALPIMVAAVDAEGLDTEEVMELTDDKILPALERLGGVASVSEMGLIETKYEFQIDPEKVDDVNRELRELIDKKMEDAKRELDEAQEELTEGKATLADESLEQTERITKAQMQLTDGKIQMAQAQTEMASARMQLQQMLQSAQQTLSQLQDQLDPLLVQKEALLEQIDQLEEGKAAIEEGVEQLETLKSQIEEQLEELGADGDDLSPELEEARNELLEQIASIDEQIADLREQGAPIEEGLETATSGLEELNAGIAQLEDGVAQAQAAVDTARNQIARLDSASSGVQSSSAQIAQGESQISQGAGALASGLTQASTELAAAQAALTIGDQQMESQEESAHDQGDLSALITPAMVAQAISAQNFAMPAGYVEDEGEEYLVRVGDQITTIEELENLVLFNAGMDGMEPITAADVGSVEKTDNAEDIYAKINGNDGIVLLMQKQSTYSTAEVSDEIGEAIRSLEEENEGLHITVLMDQGAYIDLVVDNVLQNLLYGAILAILVLFLFLRSLRPTLIIAVSIPISVVCAIVLMYFSGVNLNLISMAGLALGVGMLVDNSIVVIENTFRLRAEGASAHEAAIEGARQVAGAITASTITTICVFLPIVFTEGISRELFADMGLTIAYSLVASLIVALTLVPAMSASLLRKLPPAEPKFFQRLQEAYGRAVSWCVAHKPVVLIPVLALCVLSVWHVFDVGMSFMPEMDSTELMVTMQMPEGATFAETTAMSDTVVERIESIEDVKVVGAMTGASTGAILGGMGSSGNDVTMYVNLKEDKTITSSQAADEIREKTQDLDCEVTVSASTMDMSAYTGSGVEVRIEGTDADAMREAAEEVAQIMRDTDGTMDVSDGLEESTPEIRIVVDKDKAMEYGLTTAQVFQAVSSKISSGEQAGQIQLEGVDYPILVTERGASDMSAEEIGELELEGTVGTETRTTKLEDIAEITEGMSLDSIHRQNQVRQLTVSCQVDSAHNVSLVSREIQTDLDRYDPPTGVSIILEGENTTIMDALDDLLFMLAIAVGLIYLIMVAQFQSLLSPFIVMFTIPLAYTGGLLALYLTGFDVSIISMLGFLILSGIIVNNGIVLVDYINQLRLSGMERRDAITLAGKTRMRPVLMTALTTILGLATLAAGMGAGADMLQPMAVVTIGGLIYGTLLTLFVVPCLYDLFCKRPMSRRSLREERQERADL